MKISKILLISIIMPMFALTGCAQEVDIGDALAKYNEAQENMEEIKQFSLMTNNSRHFKADKFEVKTNFRLNQKLDLINNKMVCEINENYTSTHASYEEMQRFSYVDGVFYSEYEPAFASPSYIKITKALENYNTYADSFILVDENTIPFLDGFTIQRAVQVGATLKIEGILDDPLETYNKKDIIINVENKVIREIKINLEYENSLGIFADEYKVNINSQIPKIYFEHLKDKQFEELSV